MARNSRTVAFNLAMAVFEHHAQLWPAHEIVEVEADVVSLCEVVQVAFVEVEQVHGLHGPERRHSARVGALYRDNMCG